ncbi:hypothetical protein C6C15_16605 [Microbacterium sp. str. 'China']|nr:hypothetical protein C6C15_16605 [Microbacterium sp. str. 'China']
MQQQIALDVAIDGIQGCAARRTDPRRAPVSSIASSRLIGDVYVDLAAEFEFDAFGEAAAFSLPCVAVFLQLVFWHARVQKLFPTGVPCEELLYETIREP